MPCVQGSLVDDLHAAGHLPAEVTPLPLSIFVNFFFSLVPVRIRTVNIGLRRPEHLAAFRLLFVRSRETGLIALLLAWYLALRYQSTNWLATSPRR